jgi:hypothetical protein
VKAKKAFFSLVQRGELEMTRKKWMWLFGAILIGLLLVPIVAGAQPPAQGSDGGEADPQPAETLAVQAVLSPGFYYQGILTEAGQPVSAARQMTFQLYDAESAGHQVGTTITQTVTVSNGQFNVSLTWGADEINGRALWLRVRAQDNGGIWRDLGRQQIYAVPYAMSLYPGAVVSGADTTLTLDGGGTGLSARGSVIGVRGESWMPAAAGIPGYGGMFSSESGPGVYGSSDKSYGVQGQSCSVVGCYGGYFTGYTGVRGWSTHSHGVSGQGCNDTGCYGGYFTGDSGIYAEEQDDAGADYAGYFEGDVLVTDELVVNGPASGFFPRPAYDSGLVIGWSPGDSLELTHNLGGDTRTYVVDMRCLTGSGYNNAYIGGDIASGVGAHWWGLTDTKVTVTRGASDTTCSTVQLRIWVYQ